MARLLEVCVRFGQLSLAFTRAYVWVWGLAWAQCSAMFPDVGPQCDGWGQSAE
jgi:hypothetical protein